MVRRHLPLSFLLIGLINFAGCGRKAASCAWSEEGSQRQLDLSRLIDRQYLAHDAHTAEDDAIRYADSLARNRDDYVRIRTGCMDVLLPRVARANGVTVDESRASLEIRPLGFDPLVEGSFVILYFWLVAGGVLRRIHDLLPKMKWSYSPVNAVASVLVSALCVGIGDLWAGAMETIRIGNGHISYRLLRIPWQNHMEAIFIGGVVLFWIMTAIEYRWSVMGKSGIDGELHIVQPER